jgi:hypothetical protein
MTNLIDPVAKKYAGKLSWILKKIKPFLSNRNLHKAVVTVKRTEQRSSLTGGLCQILIKAF